MVTITKDIALTPADVAEALRRFSPEEQAETRALLGDDGDFEDELPFWAYVPPPEPLPEPPPPTPEGDRIAREAARRLNGLFPVTDPELGRWLAESPDLSIYGE